MTFFYDFGRLQFWFIANEFLGTAAKSETNINFFQHFFYWKCTGSIEKISHTKLYNISPHYLGNGGQFKLADIQKLSFQRKRKMFKNWNFEQKLLFLILLMVVKLNEIVVINRKSIKHTLIKIITGIFKKTKIYPQFFKFWWCMWQRRPHRQKIYFRPMLFLFYNKRERKKMKATKTWCEPLNKLEMPEEKLQGGDGGGGASKSWLFFQLLSPQSIFFFILQ